MQMISAFLWLRDILGMHVREWLNGPGANLVLLPSKSVAHL